MSASGTAAATSFANMTAWSINGTAAAIDVTAFGDSNLTYVQGLKDVTGSFSGYYDDSASAALFTAADSSDGVKLYLYPSSDAITKYAYGPAWVDASITTEISGAVRVSANFRANGAWGFNKL
jgi:hypothetical protein